MVKFIKDMYHKIISPFKLLNERLLLSDEKPYLLFRDWLLDAIQYGLIATIVYSIAFGFQAWKSISLVFGFGFAMWLVCETIARIRKAING